METVMQVVKEFTFNSAHYLVDYHGPCENLHGHTYKLQVAVSGPVKVDGMVLDFVRLKKVVSESVIARLDHKLLNDIIPQPTAENITLWIWQELADLLPISEIKLWETPTSFVVCRGR
jgi:6-pyruvoyltetrahydropterin/6-carboxytetrahydropterin synthase